MREFEKRLAKAEAQALAGPERGIRVFLMPAGCLDPEAWRKARQAEAGRAHAIFVRFVSPPARPPALLQ